MIFEKTYIPYGGYFSSPFCRWQGALAREHALECLANTTRRMLAKAEIAAESFDSLVLGHTVPQKHCFYGAPWVAGMIGAPGITGPTVSQACATSVRAIATAAQAIETDDGQCILALTTDRTSNGPHIYHPNPTGVGGRGDAEDPVLDNFNHDPYAKNAMIETAENVARKAGISREEQDAVALLRHAQYARALENDRAHQKKYMFSVELRQGKKTTLIETDDGIHPTTAEGLAKLNPVVPNGTVTFGTQTHPADGHAGMILASRERARRLSRNPELEIRVLSVGTARAEKGHMAMAVVPAARRALETANVALSDVHAINTHNPFAVNDALFARETGYALDQMNRFGSSLVYGHPQGPTGMRSIMELVEELAAAGGGNGLFAGCAAGDTAMALVIRVG